MILVLYFPEILTDVCSVFLLTKFRTASQNLAEAGGFPFSPKEERYHFMRAILGYEGNLLLVTKLTLDTHDSSTMVKVYEWFDTYVNANVTAAAAATSHLDAA
ncbi:hypothetical protein N7471_007272 [Penicillium samsonianum]|uniref:uncharacterized protein n=1 Tax=Penicillium samsonianum TaxID=1882272 RepID=UPI00254694B9|nr:uncharacterized protein N7471_007272 [Penicillium samsonianum]KAJ6132057.1 hypothetical protein N7471_007272 [Penicillium samsonianum]